MNIYIVRHGETEANVKKLVCGQLDTPLTQNGVEQAKKLEPKFKQIHFDHYITTPLQRAYQTAELACPGKEFIRVTDLMETDTGAMSLWNVDKLHALDSRFQQHGKYPDLKYEDGESLNDVYHRISKWFDSFISKNKNSENILIVGHGGTTNVILHDFFHVPINFYPAFSVKNGSYVKIYFNAQTDQKNILEYNKE